MPEADVIAHWRKGARDELISASLLCDGKQYASALFHCRLAVEKALKARYMEASGQDAPFTHGLLDLAESVDHPWTEAQQSALDELTDFVVGARYSDPRWAEAYATAENAARWIAYADSLLSSLGL